MAPYVQGHATTAADAIKAYVQELLKSKHQTWIELPPDLRTKWRREKFVQPTVLLLRALYGHPDAGASRNYWFPNRKLLRSTYVDDLTLSKPDAKHQAFWDEFAALVDVGPPEPVFQVLGRNHFVDVESEAPHLPSVAVANKAISFDMVEYAEQTVDLYLF